MLATGVATVARAGSSVDIDARAEAPAEFMGPHLVGIEGNADATILAALRPRGGVQRVGLRLYAQCGGNPFARTREARIDQYLTGGWRITRSMGSPTQTASFQVGVVGGFSPLVYSQIAIPAPVPGFTQIDAVLAYRYASDGLYEHPLFQVGMAGNNERVDSGAIADTLEVVDITARFRQSLDALRLPAGHGFTYAQVLRKIAVALFHNPAAANFSTFPGLPGDFQFRKEIQLLPGADGIALANEIADLFGFVIFADEWGRWTGAVHAPEVVRGPIMGAIDERDILRAVNGSLETVSIRPMPEAWTNICLEGTIQRTRTSVGRRSLPLPGFSYGHFPLKVSRYRHNSGGSYTDTGIVSAAEDRLRTESLTTLSIDGETVAAIDSEVKGWVNLSAARYSIDTVLALTALGGVYVEEQTAGALAFAWPVQRFTELSQSHSSRQYDTTTNRLKAELLETYGYVHQRAAIQSRALRSTSWEDTTNAPGINGRLVLGNGEGVVNSRARWDLIERRTVEHDSSDDGYRTYRRTQVWGWSRPEGWQYHYGTGPDSTEATETFLVKSDKEEFWAPVPGREDLHVYRWQEFGPGGQLVEAGQETRQGALEAIEERNDLAPARDDYDSDGDWQLAVAASRIEMQAMHVELEDTPIIDSWRPPREMPRTTYELAQAPWQLLNIARRFFLRGRSKVVSFSVAPNPLYRLGTWWRVRYRIPGMDIDHDGIIVESQFERRGARGPIVQRLSVVVY